ncbi:Ca2+/Na+ antiporter [Amphibacillus cookii]|nr:Ca2+/Na+ antiporter [Amphibacillus cookii]
MDNIFFTIFISLILVRSLISVIFKKREHIDLFNAFMTVLILIPLSIFLIQEREWVFTLSIIFLATYIICFYQIISGYIKWRERGTIQK